jgi:hypothetical protein
LGAELSTPGARRFGLQSRSGCGPRRIIVPRAPPSYFPAQNSTPLAFGENRPAGGKLQGRTELNLTSVVAADSFL